MALQSSGPISLADINVEFGRASNAAVSMSQLYRNGGIVGDGAPNVATSGAISLSQFYGAANRIAQTITLSANQTNYVLNTAKVTGYQAGIMDITLVIESGVYVSATTTSGRALDVDTSWAAGDTVTIVNNGFIVGMGGAGGNGGTSGATTGTVGSAGGLALRAQRAISVNNIGTIGGGGGGGGGGAFQSIVIDPKNGTTESRGGGGGGGGRSGTTNSAGGTGGSAQFSGSNGNAGTSTSGGTGGAGGNGGNSGGTGGNRGASGGTANTGRVGGSGGAAVSGNANITWIATGTRLGAIA